MVAAQSYGFKVGVGENGSKRVRAGYGNNLT